MKILGILWCTVMLSAAVLPAQTTSVPGALTPEQISGAQSILGLTFSPAERDSMRDGLNEQRQNYENIRKVALANSVWPAFQFNPLPVGFKMPEGESYCHIGRPRGLRRPATEEELAYLSIVDLSELLYTRQISSEELTRFYLARLKKYDPLLHCVITLTEERALRQARQADVEIRTGRYRGWLHGIPYGVKDLLSTREYKTTWGSVAFKYQRIDADATVIQKLDAAGAVLVAKLTMGELAWGDVWFGGKTRNPWKPEQGSSGSSAGSAAAVSAGLVPFAIGTETWGSIVSPATVCGVTGLRPTCGRVSRTGAMALSWSMDKIGALCRNASDAAIVLQTIHGPDGQDQTVYDVPFQYDSNLDIKKLRIGYLVKDFARDYAFKHNDSLMLDKLRQMGAQLVPVELPAVPVNDLGIILSAEAAAAFDELTRSNRDTLLVRQIKNAWPNAFRTARFIPAVEYINASRIRYLLIQEMARLMSEVDCYLAPSWDGDNLLLTNLSGHPSITIPNGFSADGTPTSISIIGKLFEEGTIIALAQALQTMTGHHTQRPALTLP